MPSAQACQVSPFVRLEGSKHAYYLVFEFEIGVTDKFGSTWGLASGPFWQFDRLMFQHLGASSTERQRAVRHCTVFTALALLLLAPSRAQAQPTALAPRQQVRLVYQVPLEQADCSPQSMLETSIVNRLGYQPFDALAPTTLLASVVVENGVLVGRIALMTGDSGQGLRELKAEVGSCAELVQSLALAISIALDPLATEGETAAPPQVPVNSIPPGAAAPSSASGTPALAPQVPATPVVGAPPAPPPFPPSPAPSQNNSLWELAGGFAVSPSLLPTTAFAGMLGVRYRNGMFEGGAGAFGAWSRRLDRSDGRGAQATSLAGRLELCASLSGVSACLPTYLGVVRAQGFGFATSYPLQAEVFAASGLGLRGSWDPSPGWTLELGVEAVYAFQPLIFEVNNLETNSQTRLWRQPRVPVLFQLGAAFQL